MLATLDVELNDTGFKIALALIGAGAGLLASQLGNVIMSSVAPAKTSEAGGLQGTAQNLGSSLGTAIIGAVLLRSRDRLHDRIERRTPPCRSLPASRRSSQVSRVASTSCPLAGRSAVLKAGLPHRAGAAWSPPTTATPSSKPPAPPLGAVALFALLGLVFTRNLPAGSTAVVESAPGEPTRREPARAEPAPGEPAPAGASAR